jgi:long-chain acyl-CoA synthetase
MSPTLPTRAQAIAQLTAPGAAYELQTRYVRGWPERVFVNAPASLRELYEQTATDATFLVYGSERLSFRQAWARASQIAALLVKRYGVVKGDRVALAMRNYPEWVLGFCAITSIGAIAVAVNAWWQAEELGYGLSDSGAKLMLADQERIDRFLQTNLPQVQAIAVRPTRDTPGVPALEALLESMPNTSMPEASIDPDDDAIIFYTSGSTGRPKGVVSTHRNITHAMLSWELDAQATALCSGQPPAQPAGQAAALLGIPLFHVTASHAVYLMSYRLQRKLVSMYKWDVALAAELIERERVSIFIGPAAVTGDLVQEASRTQRDLSSLLAIGGGGAPRAPEQVRQIDARFSNAMPGTGWGMTETNAIGTGIGGPEYLQRPASSGRSSAVVDLRIVDEAGRELAAGEPGELQIRGSVLFRGYWNQLDRTDCFEEGGWFRTGDVAYLDGEGYLFIVDRIKDLIIRGGENIGCGQVEAALLAHPEVMEAAVYAIPDDRLGEEVAASVQLRNPVSAHELLEFVSQHLAAFEIPRHLRLLSSPLPRTASGKILKRELREAHLAEFRRAASDAKPTDTQGI